MMYATSRHKIVSFHKIKKIYMEKYFQLVLKNMKWQLKKKDEYETYSDTELKILILTKKICDQN